VLLASLNKAATSVLSSNILVLAITPLSITLAEIVGVSVFVVDLSAGDGSLIWGGALTLKDHV
jgi:hypothetical protein